MPLPARRASSFNVALGEFNACRIVPRDASNSTASSRSGGIRVPNVYSPETIRAGDFSRDGLDLQLDEEDAPSRQHLWGGLSAAS